MQNVFRSEYHFR